MSRITITPEERSSTFRVWMRTAPKPLKDAVLHYLGLKQARRHDPEQEEIWRDQIADYFSAKMEEAGWETTRRPGTSFNDMGN